MTRVILPQLGEGIEKTTQVFEEGTNHGKYERQEEGEEKLRQQNKRQINISKGRINSKECQESQQNNKIHSQEDTFRANVTEDNGTDGEVRLPQDSTITHHSIGRAIYCPREPAPENYGHHYEQKLVLFPHGPKNNHRQGVVKTGDYDRF